MELVMQSENEIMSEKKKISRRSSILKPPKQRTPLQVIGPNPRKVNFACKQTKEFHSTEAPAVLGSSYEETFQSDSPKCIQESCITMSVIQSCTSSTLEAYSRSSSKENAFSWHEEVFNTTQIVDNNSSGSSECSEYEAGTSIDAWKIENLHNDIGIKGISHENKIRNVSLEKQTENMSPAILGTLVKEPISLITEQIQDLSKNKHLDGATEKSINIHECRQKVDISSKTTMSSACDTCETFANVAIVNVCQQEGICKEAPPFCSSGTNSKELIYDRTAITRDEIEYVKMPLTVKPINFSISQADEENKDKILTDAEMEFTDVVHVNKSSINSHKYSVQDCMDLTKADFCRTNTCGEQTNANLDESEIEFTNTVGYIATSESEETSSKISGIYTLEYDSGTTSDSSNIKTAAKNYIHKTSAYHFEPNKNVIDNNTIKVADMVEHRIDTLAATPLHVVLADQATKSAASSEICLQLFDNATPPEESFSCRKRKHIAENVLEKFDNDDQLQLSQVIKCKQTVNLLIDTVCEKKKEETSDRVSNSVSNGQSEFTHVAAFKETGEASKESQQESTNGVHFKLIADISVDNHLKLTNANWLKPALEISDCKQMESANVKECKTVAEVYSQLELTNVTASKSTAGTLDDICISKKIEDLSVHNDQLELTEVIHLKPKETFSNYEEAESPYIADYKQRKIFNDNHSGLTNITRSKLPLESPNDSCLEFTNVIRVTETVNKLCNKQMEYGNADNEPVEDHMEFTNVIGYKQSVDSSNDSHRHLKFTNVTGYKLPVENSDDNNMEFTNVITYNPNIPDGVNLNKEVEGNDSHNILTDTSSLEFTDELKLEKVAVGEKENKKEVCNDKSDTVIPDSQFELLDSIRHKPYSETNDHILNMKEVVDDNNDILMEYTGLTEMKMSSELCSEMHGKKTDTKSELVNPLNSSQLEFTTVVAFQPTANVHSDLYHSTDKENIHDIFHRSVADSQMEFTNLAQLKPASKVCREKTKIIDIRSPRTVKDKHFESSVSMGACNSFLCRKNQNSQMELTNIIESQSANELSCMKTKGNILSETVTDSMLCCTNVTEFIPNIEASCRTDSNRKRNEAEDLHYDNQLKSTNVVCFRSVENHDASFTSATKTHISGNEFNKSDGRCENIAENIDDSLHKSAINLTLMTELKNVSSQYVSTILPNIANDSQLELTNVINCGMSQNLPDSAILASEKSNLDSENIDAVAINDNMDITNKLTQISQTSDNLEFTVCKEMSRDRLSNEKSELLSHITGLELDNSEQFIVSVNAQLKDFTKSIAISKHISSNMHEMDSSNTLNSSDLYLDCNKERDISETKDTGESALGISIVSDEVFFLDNVKSNCEDATVKSCDLDIKLQLGKHLELFDKHLESSKPSKKMHLKTDSGNITNKTQEEAKDSQSQNIDHEESMDQSETNDIHLHCKPARKHALVIEDEFITHVDAPSYFESDAEDSKDLMMSIRTAEKNLLSILSSDSPTTQLSSNAESPGMAEIERNCCKKYVIEQMQSNLEHANVNKDLINASYNQPQIMVKERSAVHNSISEQPNETNSIEIEVYNSTNDPKSISFEGEKHVGIKKRKLNIVEEAETSRSEIDTEKESKLIKRKAVNMEISSKIKETELLPSAVAVKMEESYNESSTKVTIKGKTEQWDGAAAATASIGLSCAAMVQKPLSLEEWLKSERHEWDIKELSDTQWSFQFLYKSLGLILKLGITNKQDEVKPITDILLESYLTKRSAPEAYFAHHVLLKKLSTEKLKAKFKVTADVPELMNIVSKCVAEMKLLIKDFILLETCKMMEMKDNRVSFMISDMHIHAVFRITLDLSNWEIVKPENVLVQDIMGKINKKEVQNLVNAVPKGPTFLSEYVNIVGKYISVLRKE